MVEDQAGAVGGSEAHWKCRNLSHTEKKTREIDWQIGLLTAKQSAARRARAAVRRSWASSHGKERKKLPCL
jgi:hypothetical protein